MRELMSLASDFNQPLLQSLLLKEPYIVYYKWIDSGEDLGEDYAEAMRRHVENLAAGNHSSRDQSFANSIYQGDPRLSHFTDQAPPLHQQRKTITEEAVVFAHK
jgi:hypothetical protein